MTITHLIDDVSHEITIIDLGEITISHPFFSLLNYLQQIKKHHALTDEDETYQKIKDACLKNYMSLEANKHLSDAFEIAQLLWAVYGSLAQYRLMRACGIGKIISFQPGRLANSLKEFIASCAR